MDMDLFKRIENSLKENCWNIVRNFEREKVEATNLLFVTQQLEENCCNKSCLKQLFIYTGDKKLLRLDNGVVDVFLYTGFCCAIWVKVLKSPVLNNESS